jgi:hypothetical protein
MNEDELQSLRILADDTDSFLWSIKYSLAKKAEENGHKIVDILSSYRHNGVEPQELWLLYCSQCLFEVSIELLGEQVNIACPDENAKCPLVEGK